MAQNSTTLNQQVWVGAGASATMIPEMDIYLKGALCKDDPYTTIDDFDLTLVPGLYVGCTAQIHAEDTNFSGTAMITANTTDEITFDRAVGNSNNENMDVVILGFGAPVPAPTINMRKDTASASDTSAKPSLLADNWLGLVNTISPPTVDVELGQLSLALAGRNYGYQFKKNETVSGGSLDLSLGNGSWLYYALGKIVSVKHDKTANNISGSSTVVTNISDNSVDTTNSKILRVIGGNTYPPVRVPPASGYDGTILGATASELQDITANGDFTYGFGESDGDSLPSFALEITYEKDGLATDDYYVGSEGDSEEATARPFKDIYSRIFTGCQVNTLTLNFEEGQEVKTNLDLVSRRAFDSPVDYVPKRNERTASSLFNYNSTDTANQPYLFSGGTIEIFGQTVATVKSGSFTVNNNIAPQKFIGNYSRQVTSSHIPGQRTYEVSMNLLVTDTDIWDNLRAQGENTTETLTLKFQKSADDIIQIQLNDYLVQSLDVPFPEDKGPIEYAMTVSARSLVQGSLGASNTGTYYKGKWIIQNND